VRLQGIIGEDGSVTVPIQATELGQIGNLAANIITRIITPIDGITQVNNQKATDGGRGRETDEQFRDRYFRSVDFAGGVNADAIQAEILQNAEGVLAVKVYENDTSYPDHRGLPSHSVEAVVYAGMDAEIVRAIYRRKAAGIQTHGDVIVEHISQQSGQVYKLLFTRPSPIPVWIHVANLRINRDLFPADGTERIQQALIDYIGDDIHGGLNIGETVF
jgi:uncharacterized phage protein gp47/JayE